MDDLNLGKKLQMYRTSRSMSIRELSDATGITASMLSQIEHEQVNPSILPKLWEYRYTAFFRKKSSKSPWCVMTAVKRLDVRKMRRRFIMNC